MKREREGVSGFFYFVFRDNIYYFLFKTEKNKIVIIIVLKSNSM